jgi:protein gp37
MMGEKTGIAWTDHTFNPWIGCKKVSAGCAHCYAERQNAFYKWVTEWGKYYRRTSEANWKKPIQWAKQAVADGVTRRVFCASLADVFDADVPDEWLNDLWETIFETKMYGGLEWLILTKRPENISTRIPSMLCGQHSNIRIGVTAENQEMADKRIPELLECWDGKTFVSVEPMLSEVDLTALNLWSHHETDALSGWYSLGRQPEPEQFEDGNKLGWVICGSESGADARAFNVDWARSLRNQCQESSVPFFLKQMPVNGKLTVLPELDGQVWAQFPEALQ